MAKILGNFHLALVIGVALLVAAMVGLHGEAIGADGYWAQFLRYLHVFAGILWIGLLYYFNFVQIPTMPKVPAELKPGITKHIAPAALFWFRWAALATVVLGLLVAEMTQGGYSGRALMLAEGYRTIGIGMSVMCVRREHHCSATHGTGGTIAVSSYDGLFLLRLTPTRVTEMHDRSVRAFQRLEGARIGIRIR